jgi:hypothetical protein
MLFTFFLKETKQILREKLGKNQGGFFLVRPKILPILL